MDSNYYTTGTTTTATTMYYQLDMRHEVKVTLYCFCLNLAELKDGFLVESPVLPL